MTTGFQYDAQSMGTYAQWAGAGASTAAVVVAIFGNKIRRFFDRPRLDLKLSDGPGNWSIEKEKIGPQGVRDEATVWYHVTVSNPKRYPQIEGTQVLLERVEIKDVSGKYITHWRGLVAMHWRFAGRDDRYKDISRPYECDICRVVDGQFLEITTDESGFEENRFSGQTNIRLTLFASGVEADSKKLLVSVLWDGQWSPDRDKIMRHINIS